MAASEGEAAAAPGLRLVGVLAVPACVLAVLYDPLFWRRPIGLNFALYIAVLTVAFLGAAMWLRSSRNRWAAAHLVPAFILCAALVIYDNAVVHTLAPFVIVLLWAAFSLWTGGAEVSPAAARTLIPVGWATPVLKALGIPFTTADRAWQEGNTRRRAAEIAVGLLFAVPVIVVFLALFASADPIFSDWLTSVYRWLFEASALWRIFRTIILAVLLLSYFCGLLATLPWRLSQPSAGTRPGPPATVISAALLPVNVLFALFLLVQFVYLFGGEEVVHARGFTYSEYARRGFFELLWVSVFTLCITLAVLACLRDDPAYVWPRWLLVALVVLTGGIIASALKRLYLYEAAYGLTLARLYAHWIIICIAAAFALTLAGLLWRWPFYVFGKAFTVLIVAFLTVGGSINAEQIIAKANVARHLGPAGLRVDVDYLATLSADAVPYWAPLCYRSSDRLVRRLALESLDKVEKRIRREAERAGWQGFVLSRGPALAAIASARARAAQEPLAPPPSSSPPVADGPSGPAPAATR